MPARIETVTSFAKGLGVLKCFGNGQRRQTITEVAERTGMTRAAARRFLYTLCEEGLARSDGKHFELTPAVLEIGHAYLSSVTELETIRDLLHELTADLGESASAAMVDEADIVYVARSPARHRVMTIGLGVGTRLPAHATSMGQAILSQMSHNELERFLSVSSLAALTPHTLTNREALKARLKLVKERGYALVSEELELGLRSLAVPVEGRPANARLSINVSAQAARVSEERMVAEFLPRLQHAARQVRLTGS